MADLESLSDSELLALASARGIRSEPSGYDSLISGVYDAPRIAKQIPGGLYALGEQAVLAAGGDDAAQEALTDTGVAMGGGLAGTIAGAKAGGALGAYFAPVTYGLSIPAGSAVGALFGGALGSNAGDYFMDWLRGKELPTPEQARNQVLYDIGSGGVIDLATAGVLKGGKEAIRLANDVHDVAKLTTQAGREARAGSMLSKVGITEDALKQVDEADIFGKSIAEQTNNPAAGRLERALEQEYGYELTAKGQAQRAGRLDARKQTIDAGIEDLAATRFEAGAPIYEDLATRRAAMAKQVNALYEAIPGETVVSIPGVRGKISGALDRHLGEGAIALEKIDPKVEAITLDLIENADNITVEKLQNYRKILGNEAGFDKPSGANKDLAISIRTAIDDEIGEATGLSSAVKKRREMGQLYDEGAVGDILAPENKYGGRNTPDSAVVSKILRTPEAAEQFVKAGGPEARQMVADVVQREFKELVAADKLGTAINQFQKNEATLKRILLPEQYSALRKTVTDVQSQLEFEKLITQPSARQSGTSQFTGDKKGLKNLMGLDVSFSQKHPILTTLGAGVVGHVAGAATGVPFGNIFGGMAGMQISARLLSGLKNVDSDIARYSYKALTNKAEAGRLLQLAAKSDPFATNILSFIDEATNRAAKSLGIEPSALASVAAEIPTGVANVGVDQYNEDQRIKRIQAESILLDELDDAQLLNLARSRGLVGDSKKKVDERVLDQNGVEDVSFNRSSYSERSAEVDLPDKVTDELLDAVRQVESGGGKYLLSPAGAEGPYQLMPATGKRIHKKLGIKEPYDPYNEEQARKIAKYHLEDGLERFGRMDLALADYNAGHSSIKAALSEANSDKFDAIKQYLPTETALYVPKVYKALMGRA